MNTFLLVALVVGLVAVAGLAMWLRRGSDVVVVPPGPQGAAAPPGDAPAEVQALLAQGNTIGAIKRVRELTGLGLKEAKDYVDALQAGTAPPLAPPPAPQAPAPADPAQLEQAARAALARGSKIEAIKHVRQLTGWGLKEAKDYIERL